MAVSFQEVLMALGEFSVDIKPDAEIISELEDYAHVIFQWGAERLYTGVILGRVPGGVYTVKGRGLEWWGGMESDGPLIEFREYLSGKNKLSNGSFENQELYWEVDDQTKWEFRAVDGEPYEGLYVAHHTATTSDDDILRSTESYESRADIQYQLQARVKRLAGTIGKLRLRGVCEGSYSTPNLLYDANFEAGDGWTPGASILEVVDAVESRSGNGVLKIGQTPRPQDLPQGDMEGGGAGWVGGIDIDIVTDAPHAHSGTGVMKCGPNTRPDILVNGNLESGSTGWTGGTDITIVTDAPHARSGTKVMKVGPVTQPDIMIDGDMEGGPTGFTITENTDRGAISEIVNDPGNAHTGNWVLVCKNQRKRAVSNGGFEELDGVGANVLNNWDNADGNWGADFSSRSGDYSVQVTAPPGQTALYGYAPPEHGGPPDHFTLVSEGEKWRMTGYMANDIVNPTDGHAQLEIHVVSGPREDIISCNPAEVSTNFTWQAGVIDKEIEHDYVGIAGVLACEFTTGFWYFDDIMLERIEGNEEILTSAAMTVVAGETYHPKMFGRSDPAFISGGVFPRVVISGAGKEDVIKELTPFSQTDNQWYVSEDDVTIEDGYTSMVIVLRVRDISGGPIYIDDITCRKVANNVDTIVSSAMSVIAGEAYDFTVYAHVGPQVINGDATVRLTVSGSGKPDATTDLPAFSKPSSGYISAVANLTIDEGYTTIRATVIATNLYGDSVYLDDMSCVRVVGNVDSISSDPITVAAGEEFDFANFARAGAGYLSGELDTRVTLLGSGKPDVATDLTPVKGTDGDWVLGGTHVTVDEGYTSAVITYTIRDVFGDSIYVDDATFIRTKGNVDTATSRVFAVVPEHTYQLLGSIRSGPALIGGEAGVAALFTADDREDLVADIASQQSTEDGWVLLSGSLKPPSGYDQCQLMVVGRDVFGDSFYLDDMAVQDEEKTTKPFDLKSASTQADWSLMEQVITCPASTTGFHAEVVAESLGGGWLVDSVSVIRVDQEPKPVATIMRELLIHPKTSLPVLSGGEIVGDDLPQWDWTIKNTNLRDCWAHLSQSGLALPLREYVINYDAELSWDVPEELFEDREKFVLLGRDMIVKTRPTVERNVEASLTDLKIIGAVRTSTDGVMRTVIGSAQVELPGVDWFGNPLSRQRISEDSSLDHDDFATAVASEDLDSNNNAKDSFTVSISDWRTLSKVDVGDWLYLYDPVNDVQDKTRSIRWKGRVIHPIRDRLLSRTWSVGAGRFKILLRKLDGSVIDISKFVLWSEGTSADLEIGSFVADFVVDPQGGAAGNQFLNFRKSSGIA